MYCPTKKEAGQNWNQSNSPNFVYAFSHAFKIHPGPLNAKTRFHRIKTKISGALKK
jgi:hypothetical protein